MYGIGIAILSACAQKPKPIEHALTGWAHGDTEAPAPRAAFDEDKPSAIEYNPPIVYFTFNTAELRTSERDKLYEMRDRLAGKCIVEGYASPEGTDDYNLALGHKRAQAVVDYLHALGRKDAFGVMSYGENAPVSNDDPDLYWLDRRVLVVCQ